MKVEEIDRFDGRVEGVVHDDRWIRKSIKKKGEADWSVGGPHPVLRSCAGRVTRSRLSLGG